MRYRDEKLRANEKYVEARETRRLRSPVVRSPLITAVVLVGLVIALMAAVVWLANQVGDNITAVLGLGAVTVVLVYPPLLFSALSAGLINQKTFSKLSLGIIDKISAFNLAKSDGDDD